MFESSFLVLVGIYGICFILSISLHEAAHAFSANFFGDRTPKSQGRLTLNPFRHLSLVGTIFPIAAVLFKLPILFGWGKPVNVDYRQMSMKPFSVIAVAAAGPIANLLLALCAAILQVRMVDENWANLLSMFIGMNVLLFVFNLLPLAPLDGSTILTNILPRSLRELYEDYIAPYAFYIFLALIISGKISWVGGVAASIQHQITAFASLFAA